MLHLPETDEWHVAGGLVQLSVPGALPANILPGDRVAVRATLAPPQTYGTPGTFDYGKHLAAKNIRLIGWTGSSSSIIKINALQEPGVFSRLGYMTERFRHHALSFIDSTVSTRYRGLYKALLLGERGELPPDIAENFKSTGAFHLLAISGMHMGVVALFFFSGATWLLKRSEKLLLNHSIRKIAAAAALPALAFYALAAGFQAPVARAMIMIAVFVIAIILDRQWHLPTNIAIAALFILLWNPASLYTPSFQLSFAAVIGIVLLMPLFQNTSIMQDKRLLDGSAAQKVRAWILASIAVSCAAMLTTAPLQLIHFNRISLLSPISTLLIAPLLCMWTLPLGLIALVLFPVIPSVAKLLLSTGTFGLWTSDWLTLLLANIPFSSLWFSTPSTAESFFYYTALTGAVLIASSHRRFGKILLAASLVLLTAVTSAAFLGQKLTNDAEVSFIDIGQGSSTLLELPGGSTILVDGGAEADETFDPGERIIAPFLWQKRIGKLDAVVVSHQHTDHYNGLEFILKRFTPKTLWVNDDDAHYPEFENLLNLARSLGVEIKVPEPGEVIHSAKGATLTNIGDMHIRPNTLAMKNGKRHDENDLSMVLRFEYTDRSILLPGDTQKAGESTLLAGENNIRADVLLSPHHGSSTSNSREFLEEVSPDYMVVSAGRNKSKLFPRPALLTLCKEKGIAVLSTPRQGTVSFKLEDGQIEASSFF